MKSRISQRPWVLMRVILGLFLVSFGGERSAPAQGADGTIEHRLAQMEERLARLEAENQQLRERLAGMESIRPVAAQGPASQAGNSTSARPPQAPAAAAETPPPRVAWGAEIRLRPESRRDFSDNVALNNFILQRVRLNARLRLTDTLTGLVQLQDSRFWGQEASTASNESNLDLRQGYLQVDRFLAPHLSLRLGRQELIYGNERLVGAFGWDNIGRSFDALKFSYTEPQWTTDFFFSRLNDRRNAGRGDGSQDLIGLYTHIGKSGGRWGLEPYVLYLRDGLATRGEKGALIPEPTCLVTLGFRHFASFASGLGYDVENAYQVGQNGPDTHRAAAVAAVGRYRSAGRLAPEAGFEYDFATGDSDPKDGRSEEFNNLFPTNHLLYGYADYLGWRNMQDFKPYFSFAPFANGRAELSYHRFLLVESRGAWKNAGGKVLGLDPTGLLGTDLGHEVDLTLTFPLYERVRVLGGYSVFIPGKFARGTQGPQASQFGYLQTLVTF
ncbi:MAG: alginate export family protein [Acidobacteria bacterium]|nr:alginate export family protein [Acidobacteriota bacterium]